LINLISEQFSTQEEAVKFLSSYDLAHKEGLVKKLTNLSSAYDKIKA